MFRKLMDCVERKGSRRMAVRGILTNKRGILKTKKYTQDQKLPKIGYTHFTYLLVMWYIYCLPSISHEYEHV